MYILDTDTSDYIGTNFVGGSFGPIMVVWFSMLGIFGFSQLVYYPDIFRAINPAFAVKFLSDYTGGPDKSGF
jgi:KUP system potassium uptake protein